MLQVSVLTICTPSMRVDSADIRRTRHIGDFTHWKDHDSYQTAFQRLLRDLKSKK
jgi:hypothetical protein